MDSVIEKFTEWLKGILVSGIMNNLSGMFASVNEKVGTVASEIGTTPSEFSPAVFSMIRNLSETVILPVAGIILTFIACYELIQMVTEHNNLANLDTWIFFKWIFKTAVAVLLISNTFDIVMAVFDVGQYIVQQSSGLIQGGTAIDDGMMSGMQSVIEGMELGEVIGLYLQSFLVQFLVHVLSAAIFVIVYGRMIEIYLMTSLAPIPMATFGNREQSQMGQNYLKSLAALSLQGFLIMICIAIYSVLVQTVSVSDDIIGSLWGIVGYTVLLCFTLFKTGSVAQKVLSAH
ncbi:MAG: CD0415/CD1112 family protein [Eubacteriales bacterium]|nr:CD0415/CD1112 family protein [Eubacteriales bacterium]